MCHVMPDNIMDMHDKTRCLATLYRCCFILTDDNGRLSRVWWGKGGMYCVLVVVFGGLLGKAVFFVVCFVSFALLPMICCIYFIALPHYIAFNT